MMIYLDMDGTIADFYQGAWLEDLMASNPRPYAKATRLVSEEQLKRLTDKGYELGIISWLAKNSTKEFDKAVRKTKKEWLASNYPNIKFSEIHIVKYGTPKHYVCKVKGQLLIDDEERNRLTWKGQAYHPNEFFK